ncbi:MAG: hypothetical protein ACK56I_29575, partial [bacterium]
MRSHQPRRGRAQHDHTGHHQCRQCPGLGQRTWDHGAAQVVQRLERAIGAQKTGKHTEHRQCNQQSAQQRQRNHGPAALGTAGRRGLKSGRTRVHRAALPKARELRRTAE